MQPLSKYPFRPGCKMLRVEEQVRVGHGRRGRRAAVSVVREHYLRDDISCRVQACALCGELNIMTGVPLLSRGAGHYSIPDADALASYLEVFEQPGVTGLILLQTALAHVRGKAGGRLHSRASALLHSPVKECITFSNEHHFETFRSREGGEGMGEWQRRLVFTAGVWYSNHLTASGSDISIVISYSVFAGGGDGVSVLGVEEWLVSHWPALSSALSLCLSLSASLSHTAAEEEEEEGSSSAKVDFPKHLSSAEVSEGLAKGRLFMGRLRVSRYHSRDEAFVSPHTLTPITPREGGEGVRGDVLICGSTNRNRAVHGDSVVVRLLPRAEWRGRSHALPHTETTPTPSCSATSVVMATGVVVGVAERADREYVASFEEDADSSRGRTRRLLVLPYDTRIPKIRIATRQADQLLNHRIVVRIDSWEPGSRYPNGHFVRSIGPIGELETETSVILIEHQLAASAPFSAALLAELPVSGEGWSVSGEEVGRRRDLRHSHLVFSIDPQGCEDVDDALSIRQLAGGLMELGVHIADVSHFVPEGSLTDLEARERSTSIYLADRRFDMLPAVLSAGLCSLLSGVDRYAVSVLWQLDPAHHVKGVWFGRTVIQSRYKLAYETAQALFDGASPSSVLPDIPELGSGSWDDDVVTAMVEELRTAVSLLVGVARSLRQRRDRQGGLELEGVEVRVQLNDKDRTEIEDLIPKQPLEMHETIAECMIFANHWVAKKLHTSFPGHALLRHHPAPQPERFAPLVQCAAARGLSLETGSNKALAQSLDDCVDHSDPHLNKVLRHLATQAMTPAAYCSTGSLPPDHLPHYGLALKLYTHFTSPIRRYADLVVHRQLLAAVGEGASDRLPGNASLQAMAEHMNDKHRCAQLAQMASVELFQALYFKQQRGREGGEGGGGREDVRGVVFALRDNGVMVFVPRYGLRAPVYLKDRSGLVAQPAAPATDQHSGEVTFNSGSIDRGEHAVTVSYSSGQYTLCLLDHVLVRVCVEQSRSHAAALSLRLLHCGPAPPEAGGGGGGGATAGGKKELVNVVKAEALEYSEGAVQHGEVGGAAASSSSSSLQYQQSSSSLYHLMLDMHSLALQDST